MFDQDFYTQLQMRYMISRSQKYLTKIRDYLDSCDMKYPKPKYKFDLKNMDTWKYLDSKVHTNKDNSIYLEEVLNPRFKYANL